MILKWRCEKGYYGELKNMENSIKIIIIKNKKVIEVLVVPKL